MNKRTKQPSGSARERARLKRELAERRRKERTILIAAVLVIVLVVGGGIGVQYWRTHRAPSAGPVESVDFAPVTVEPEKPLVLGVAGAPVTLTVFSDFHCPHCVEFEEMFGETITTKQREGTVALEVYSMTIIDEGSATSANAMACAAEADFGQAYYQALWANADRAWSADQLIDLADQLDIDAGDEFASCVTDLENQAWVDSMDAAAQAHGVTGTPTVFLDGEPLSLDGLSPQDLADRIDAAVDK